MKFIHLNNDLINLAQVTNIHLNGMDVTIFYSSGGGTRIGHDDVKQAAIRFAQLKLQIDSLHQDLKVSSLTAAKGVAVKKGKRKGKVNE